MLTWPLSACGSLIIIVMHNRSHGIFVFHSLRGPWNHLIKMDLPEDQTGAFSEAESACCQRTSARKTPANSTRKCRVKSRQPMFSEAQSWRKRNMTHQCSHERAPASAHASAHASVHESAHKSWLSLSYNPIQRLPLECSRECSRGCPRKCTRSGLVVCHLVCFHLLYSLPTCPTLGQLLPEGPAIEKINPDRKCQSRLKFSISLENVNPGPSEFPTKNRVWQVARLKISIQLEIFNPGGRS